MTFFFDFLKRYLWIFQHLINNITSKLDDIHKYFNPMEAPKDFFLWLASWFSINTNFSIPEEKMRLLVKEAVNFYRWRGTVIGITKFLEIITGVMPTIIENYIQNQQKAYETNILAPVQAVRILLSNATQRRGDRCTAIAQGMQNN